jgi:hypothetical protein
MSFKKLPTMVVSILTENGFSKYCTLVSKVGSGFAFWLYRHWKTRELRDIRLEMERKERERAKKDEVSRPERGNFPNMKSFKNALEMWQKNVNCCRPCYRMKYARWFHEGMCFWKGNEKYSMLSYRPCGVCGAEPEKS